MNIRILDLIIFFKKKFVTSIFVLILSFGLFYVYSNINKTKDQLTFHVDLREWGYLNTNTFIFLDKYTKYGEQIEFSVFDSFGEDVICKKKESIKNLLLCSVRGESITLEKDYARFIKQVKLILKKQDSEFRYEIEGRISKIQQTKDFVKESSKNLMEAGKIELLTDLNYKSYIKISEIESSVELLKNIKKSFEKKVITKNKKLKNGIPTYELKYGILFSILCLGIYLIMGLTYSINVKRRYKKKTK
jgi:hypothetical protein